MCHDDLAFVRSVVGFLTTDRWRSAGINCEFEIEDRKLDTGTIEAVPVRLDDVDNGSADVGSDIETDAEIFLEFRKVALTVPYMNISADVEEGCGGMANGFTKLLELEDTLVNVIAVIHCDIAVDRLRTPYFGWNIDGEGTGSRLGKRSRKIGVGIGQGIRYTGRKEQGRRKGRRLG